MALNTIARRMFLQKQKDSKEFGTTMVSLEKKREQLEFYENKEHKKLIKQLRQSWKPRMYATDLPLSLYRNGGGSMTPELGRHGSTNNVSACSTFDNVSPLRDRSPGANGG